VRWHLLPLAAALLLACVPTQAAPAPSPTPIAISSSTRSELEAVLVQRSGALAGKDLKAFQQTIDLTRLAFRRCENETFDIASRNGVEAAQQRIVLVEPYGTTYVRAYLDEGRLGVRRLYFRREADRWILTQPKIDELGAEITREIYGVKMQYWAVDEDIIEFMAREAAATREYVKRQARGELRDPYAVKVFPTNESAGIAGCHTIAFSRNRQAQEPLIGFYQLWLDPSLQRVSDYTSEVFQHEGLHYVQDQFSPGILFRLDWWLIEGWPDYTAGTRSRTAIAAAVCARDVPPLKRLIDGVPTEPDTPPELSGRYYALANSLTEYVVRTYGTDAYWNLVALYKDDPNYRLTYPKVFKVSPDAFYEAWLSFARARYC
jgi:hypothetical protein